MDRNIRTKKSSIVPGKHMLSEAMAMHYMGMPNDESCLAERSADESAILDCTRDREERNWRKQGLSEDEIFRRQEARTQKKHADAEARLEAQKGGAKDFVGLLEMSQYFLQRLDIDDEDDVAPQENVFAVPALPKHVNVKSTVMSPAARAVGKPGFGCSTPVGGKDLSMRSLKTLDISHVVNTDSLKSKNINVQEKNVRISLKRPSYPSDSTLERPNIVHRDDDSELRGTFTIAKDSEGSLQGTFTVGRESEQSLQGTFVKEAAAGDEQNQSSSLQGTFVKAAWEDSLNLIQQPTSSISQRTLVKNAEPSEASIENNEESSSLQGTFVKAVDKTAEGMQNTLDIFHTHNGSDIVEKTIREDVSVVQNTMEGGKNRSGKKTDLGEREKRMADMTNSLMSSMIDDAPSPGAHAFKNIRKKMRHTVATPPRISRVSIESDKEKTIEMLSIAEEQTMESNGSTFVDPISVNGSRVSPVPEHDESQPMEITVTPKSTRRNVGLRHQPIEKDRANATPSRLSIAPILADTLIATPARNYEKPTFATLGKNKNPKNAALYESEKAKQLEKMHKKTPARTPVPAHSVSPLDEKEQEEVVVNNNRSPMPDTVEEPDELTLFPVSSRTAIRNVEADMSSPRVNDHHVDPDYDVDFDDDRHRRNQQQEESDEEYEQELSPVQRPMSRQSRRIALLSDSVCSVNTPGLDRNRSTRYQGAADDTVADNWNPEEERDRLLNDVPEGAGLKLAKRRLIEPKAHDDGLRRSTRVRVKPVRSWLGEQPVYVNSPSGARRLKGVTDVIIKDKRFCKYRTADFTTAVEREQQEKAMKKARAQQRRAQEDDSDD